MNFFLDWFAFTLKGDNKSQYPRYVDLSFIVHFLGLDEEFSNFVDTGAHLHYQHIYRYNNVSIKVPAPTDCLTQGFNVEMTSQGIAWYLSRRPVGYTLVDLMKKLRDLVNEGGYSLNYSRVDFAVDDKIVDGQEREKLLDLDVIIDSARKKEYSSLFRRANKEGLDFNISEDISKKGFGGRTLYFGNRKSNTFLRIYDKLAEQYEKNKNDSKAISELFSVNHWVRFELEFKDKSANKLVALMLSCSAERFQQHIPKVINTYIRFVNNDDSCISRCSLKDWWLKFIGTAERAKFTSQVYTTNALSRSLRWIARIATTLRAVEDNIGEFAFQEYVNHYGTRDKYRARHKELSRVPCREELPLTNWQEWQLIFGGCSC